MLGVGVEPRHSVAPMGKARLNSDSKQSEAEERCTKRFEDVRAAPLTATPGARYVSVVTKRIA